MITQRPVTGSRRSSGIECVLKDHYLRPAIVEMNRDDVEAARAISEMMARHVLRREPRDAPLLRSGDRLRRVSELAAVPRLHFHEHRRLAIASDDVNFSKASSVAAIKNCVPQACELGAREIFTVFSEDLTGIV